MRVIADQLNVWGKAATSGGLDPQRSDLWNIDLSQAVAGLSEVLGPVPSVRSFFAQSLVFPELKIKPEQVRRDSRPYSMPGFDEACDPIKITFILDAPEPGKSSLIYRVLNQWRRAVRAGRGAMSNSKDGILLNANYRIDYAFNINVFLLNGTAGKQSVSSVSPNVPGVLAPIIQTRIDNDLDYSGAYTLVNAWLSGFKLSDVSHVDTRIMTIEATFYAEDVFDVNTGVLLQ